MNGEVRLTAINTNREQAMNSLRTLSLLAVVVTAALVAAGCGSSKRTTVEGYSDESLMRKRIFVLYPSGNQVTLGNTESFAYSRGVAAASAMETLDGELRTLLVPSLNQRLDSNTILGYSEEPVGRIVSINPSADFAGGKPKSWDQIERAAKEANIDYMLVINPIRINNSEPGTGKGDETVTANYLLLDTQKKKVMTSGEIEVTIEDPRTAATTYERLAAELTKKLPFWVGE